MKVLLVTRAAIGGAARHVLDIARGLAGRHDLTFLASPEEDPSFLDRLAETGSTVIPLPLPRRVHPGFDFAAVEAIRKEVAKRRPDLIHAHAAKPGALTRIAAGSVPVVYSPHGFFHQYPTNGTTRALARAAARAAEHLLARRARRICFTAEWEREAALNDGLAPGERLVVVPNGVPISNPLPPEERRELRAELGVAPDETLVLMASRLKAPKDPITFLEAAGHAGPGHRFVLLGDGPLMALCRQTAPANAVLPGHRRDAARLLLASDIAVLATEFEGCSYFLLEAMAAGLPVVATDIPGNREPLADTGILVPRRDAEALGREVASLRKDKTRRTALGAAARTRVAARHSIEAMLAATEAAWEAGARF